MPWVKIDDNFPQHPKVAKAGPFGLAMQVAGLCYCNRNLTDGFIPYGAARTLISWEYPGPVDAYGQRLYTCAWACGMVSEEIDSEYVIGVMVESGLWEEVQGGYVIHDYLEFQPSKADVLRDREAAKARMGALRKK